MIVKIIQFLLIVVLFVALWGDAVGLKYIATMILGYKVVGVFFGRN